MLPADFWVKYHIEEFKHYQFFNYRNSDFFFSKFVVLGESKNDCQVFQQLIEPDIGDKIADVSFLDAGGVENMKYPYFLLKELKIPFIIIVDRDYFFPYLINNELDQSRTPANGLPRYSDELKDDEVINDIFPSPQQKRKLIDAHRAGYRKFYDQIEPYGILSMNYCLEMDLTCSSLARQKYYHQLHITPDNQTQKFLLENNFKAIKKIERILPITTELPKQHLPESYKKIKKSIIARLKESIWIANNISEFVVLDMREQDEYDSRHNPGAILVSAGSNNENTITGVIPEKDFEVWVYYRSGNCSKAASTILRNWTTPVPTNLLASMPSFMSRNKPKKEKSSGACNSE